MTGCHRRRRTGGGVANEVGLARDYASLRTVRLAGAPLSSPVWPGGAVSCFPALASRIAMIGSIEVRVW